MEAIVSVFKTYDLSFWICGLKKDGQTVSRTTLCSVPLLQRRPYIITEPIPEIMCPTVQLLIKIGLHVTVTEFFTCSLNKSNPSYKC